MNLFFSPCSGAKNFGDLISTYLYSKITGDVLVEPRMWDHERGTRISARAKYVHPKYTKEDVHLITGSLFDTCETNVIVWGIGLYDRASVTRPPKSIHCVRGPLTRQRFLDLGIDCPECYGDPALLLPRYYTSNVQKQYKVGIIPHYVDYDAVTKLYRDQTDILIIDILSGVEEVADAVNSCENTLSSSLHGIIVTHAYSIPSYWIRCSNSLTGDGVKFHDYFQSVGIDVSRPYELRTTETAETLLEKVSYQDNPAFPIHTQHILDSCPFGPPPTPTVRQTNLILDPLYHAPYLQRTIPDATYIHCPEFKGNNQQKGDIQHCDALKELFQLPLENIVRKKYDNLFFVLPVLCYNMEHQKSDRVAKLMTMCYHAVSALADKVIIIDNHDYDYDPTTPLPEFINCDYILKRCYSASKSYPEKVIPFPFVLFGTPDPLTQVCFNRSINNSQQKNRVVWMGSLFRHYEPPFCDEVDRIRMLRDITASSPYVDVPGNKPYNEYVKTMGTYSMILDLSGASKLNKRLYEGFSQGSLVIRQKQDVLWPLEPGDMFDEASEFETAEEAVRKISALVNDPALYRRCLDTQNRLVNKYMNPTWIWNYISSACNISAPPLTLLFTTNLCIDCPEVTKQHQTIKSFYDTFQIDQPIPTIIAIDTKPLRLLQEGVQLESGYQFSPEKLSKLVAQYIDNLRQNKYLEHALIYESVSLVDSYKYTLKHCTTPYLFFLEHDWTFSGVTHSMPELLEMLKTDGVNRILFNKWVNDHADPHPEFPLIQTTRMSNNPHLEDVEFHRKHYQSLLHKDGCSLHPKVYHYVYKGVRLPGHCGGIECELDTATKLGSYMYGTQGMSPATVHLDGTQRQFLNQSKE